MEKVGRSIPMEYVRDGSLLIPKSRRLYYETVKQLRSIGTLGVALVIKQCDVEEKVSPAIRDSMHQFIFPKQEAELSVEYSGTMSAQDGGFSFDYELRKYTFTPEIVLSGIELHYAELTQWAHLSVAFLQGEDRLTPPVEFVLNNAGLTH